MHKQRRHRHVSFEKELRDATHDGKRGSQQSLSVKSGNSLNLLRTPAFQRPSLQACAVQRALNDGAGGLLGAEQINVRLDETGIDRRVKPAFLDGAVDRWLFLRGQALVIAIAIQSISRATSGIAERPSKAWFRLAMSNVLALAFAGTPPALHRLFESPSK